MKRGVLGACLLTLGVGVFGPAALSRAEGSADQVAVDVPLTTCTGSFTAILEYGDLESGRRTAADALDSYFQESTASWESAPEVADELGAATASAVDRGGWLETAESGDESVTMADLVSDGEVVARFYVLQLPDDTWRVEGFDYCPSAASDAGLVLRSGT